MKNWLLAAIELTSEFQEVDSASMLGMLGFHVIEKQGRSYLVTIPERATYKVVGNQTMIFVAERHVLTQMDSAERYWIRKED